MRTFFINLRHFEGQILAGHYRISNVVTTDAPGLTGTEHIGYLAVRQIAGEHFSGF